MGNILKPIALVILLPIVFVLFFLGFRSCWQCHRTNHRFLMRLYKLRLFEDERQLVCRECHDLLNRVR